MGRSTRQGRGPVISCGRRVVRGLRESWIVENGTGARSNGGGDDADGGENIGLAWKLLPVLWNPV
jgi:hypothetical protein